MINIYICVWNVILSLNFITKRSFVQIYYCNSDMLLLFCKINFWTLVYMFLRGFNVLQYRLLSLNMHSMIVFDLSGCKYPAFS